MELVHGMICRLWCTCGLIVVIGLFCLLIEWIEKTGKMSTLAAGCLCILLGISLGTGYSWCLLHPDTEVFSGTFEYRQRKSGVLPPILLAKEYVFRNEQGESGYFYLDSQAAKELFPNGLEKGRVYTVTYEDRTDIILRIE